jgi:hypothetical protein
MPTIDLTDEQAEELKDLLTSRIDFLQSDWEYDPSNPDDIATLHGITVLSDILELLEIA